MVAKQSNAQGSCIKLEPPEPIDLVPCRNSKLATKKGQPQCTKLLLAQGPGKGPTTWVFRMQPFPAFQLIDKV